ncbi:uncharacterized protein LOC128255594 [Drosophila gunungcola]|uniref:uncharacterized protein LOC128255594 n=1 Tax=Drosophila gunungcola TaxID=103775 RepID=UPI0022E48F44|nr:uncharacterized protein LOC128255594 [Drosophila gunungcola]
MGKRDLQIIRNRQFKKSAHVKMEGPLSLFLQVDPACLILIVLGLSLVEYMFNNSSVPKQDFAGNPRSYKVVVIRKSIRCESETPLARYCGLRHLQLRHRAKMLSGVKRRLDQQF